MSQLPPNIESLLLEKIRELSNGASWKTIGNAVVQLSDHYQLSGSVTPWQIPLLAAAYLAYHYPLNFARGKSVLGELPAGTRFESINDFGSGPGVMLHLASGMNLANSYTFDENSSEANSLQSHLSQSLGIEAQPVSPKDVLPNSLLLASFALNEISEMPQAWLNYDHLAFVVPATYEYSQQLIRLRSQLKGYRILAPCTHQSACPLQNHDRDWCHFRIPFVGPSWWQELESHLPMKNRTITFSYLIASKTLPEFRQGWTRIIGDTRIEKGRSRVLCCRSNIREDLEWLSRNKDIPRRFELQRGQLVKLPDAAKPLTRVDAPHLLETAQPSN